MLQGRMSFSGHRGGVKNLLSLRDDLKLLKYRANQVLKHLEDWKCFPQVSQEQVMQQHS
jgi:hypothetical protein